MVTATEFDLVDSSGAVRGKLYMADNENPTLGLYDTQGRETVSLWSTPDADEGAFLRLASLTNSIVLSTYASEAWLEFDDLVPSSSVPVQPRFKVQTSYYEHLLPSRLTLFGENGRVLWEVP